MAVNRDIPEANTLNDDQGAPDGGHQRALVPVEKVPGPESNDVIAMRYRGRTMMPDMLRSGLGLVLCLVIAVVPGIIEFLHWTAAGLSILFVLYLVRTVWRLQSRLYVSEYGVRQSGLFEGTAFAWPELSDFRLRYFSTRRDGKKGWFEMTLRAPGAKVVVESTLEGFDRLLELARDAARDNALLVDDITRTNLMRMDEAETMVRAASKGLGGGRQEE